MSWNYRVIEFTDPKTGPYRQIHEVFYADDGSLEGYAEEPAVVIVDVLGDDGACKKAMALALQKREEAKNE